MTKDKIHKLLSEKLQPDFLEVIDDSAKHVGHSEAKNSAGGHFAVKVVSKIFEGKNLVMRHRLIYQSLEEIKSEIHALAIKALTPEEFK